MFWEITGFVLEFIEFFLIFIIVITALFIKLVKASNKDFRERVNALIGCIFILLVVHGFLYLANNRIMRNNIVKGKADVEVLIKTMQVDKPTGEVKDDK